MNILAVGAHHDDLELGCGGTLARFAAEGHSVRGLVLTDSETHYDLKGIHRTRDEAEVEARRAAEVIGMELCDLHHPKAENGLLQYDVKLMREIESFIALHEIDTVFSHWRYDMNTDHEAAHRLTTVAARHVPRILVYRSNWYQPDRAFNGILYVDISDYIELKVRALECYTVEIRNRSRQWIDSFIDRNRSLGFSIGGEYAEVFEPVRYVI
jgi:LmbE family N-acetylglucosaminyl deacetylase